MYVVLLMFFVAFLKSRIPKQLPSSFIITLQKL